MTINVTPENDAPVLEMEHGFELVPRVNPTGDEVWEWSDFGAWPLDDESQSFQYSCDCCFATAEIGSSQGASLW
jgi:hypothetical protein